MTTVKTASGQFQVSKNFNLNTSDLMIVLKNAALVGAAAALTAVVDSLGNIEMGENMVVVIPIVTMVLNTVVKFLTSSVYMVEDTKKEIRALASFK
jgi:hypothetical protein